MPFSILIPNYNGCPLLQEYLPSVLDAAEYSAEQYDVMVVDDGSSDGSGEFIRRKFPKVQVLENEKNVGFGESVNRGMASSRHRIVVLLNNDVRIERDFFQPLIQHFDNSKIFSIVARGLIEQDGIIKNESVTKFEFKDGFLKLIQPGLIDPDAKFDQVCTVAHACGGFSAFDREKFLELGGFDDIYYPFYWEDVDICYKAWKRGWWSLYEPKSVAHHRAHATIDEIHKREYIEMVHVRNKLLFTWKNMTGKELLVEHAYALNSYIKVAPEHFRNGFYEALKKIDKVFLQRQLLSGEEPYSDYRIFNISANKPFDINAVIL